MRRLFAGVFAALVLQTSGPALAHHGGGGSGASALFSTVSERLLPPRSRLFFNFEVDSLDESLGVVVLYQLQGEYAITPFLSLGARIPFWSVREDLLPDNTRIGDVAFVVKGRVWKSQDGSMNLNLGLDTSFPTGNSTESLGAGTVVMSPFLSLSDELKFLQWFIALSSSFELASDVNPSLLYQLGLIFPLYRKSQSLDWLLSFQGTTFVASDTFENGSSKGYIVAGLLFQFSEHWDAALLGKVSVLDTLDIKPGVPFFDFATGLLNDVKAGFMLNLGYKF